MFESDLPREVAEIDDELFTVYDVDAAGSIAMPARLTHYQPRVSAGVALKGPWIELTPMEQRMVVAGTTGFLIGALCGASRAACAITGAAILSLGVVLNERGACPGDQRLLIEYTWQGMVRGQQCR